MPKYIYTKMLNVEELRNELKLAVINEEYAIAKSKELYDSLRGIAPPASSQLKTEPLARKEFFDVQSRIIQILRDTILKNNNDITNALAYIREVTTYDNFLTTSNLFIKQYLDGGKLDLPEFKLYLRAFVKKTDDISLSELKSAIDTGAVKTIEELKTQTADISNRLANLDNIRDEITALNQTTADLLSKITPRQLIENKNNEVEEVLNTMNIEPVALAEEVKGFLVNRDEIIDVLETSNFRTLGNIISYLSKIGYNNISMLLRGFNFLSAKTADFTISNILTVLLKKEDAVDFNYFTNFIFGLEPEKVDQKTQLKKEIEQYLKRDFNEEDDRKIDEYIRLYKRAVETGYSPDQFTDDELRGFLIADIGYNENINMADKAKLIREIFRMNKVDLKQLEAETFGRKNLTREEEEMREGFKSLYMRAVESGVFPNQFTNEELKGFLIADVENNKDIDETEKIRLIRDIINMDYRGLRRLEAKTFPKKVVRGVMTELEEKYSDEIQDLKNDLSNMSENEIERQSEDIGERVIGNLNIPPNDLRDEVDRFLNNVKDIETFKRNVYATKRGKTKAVVTKILLELGYTNIAFLLNVLNFLSIKPLKIVIKSILKLLRFTATQINKFIQILGPGSSLISEAVKGVLEEKSQELRPSLLSKAVKGVLEEKSQEVRPSLLRTGVNTLENILIDVLQSARLDRFITTINKFLNISKGLAIKDKIKYIPNELKNLFNILDRFGLRGLGSAILRGLLETAKIQKDKITMLLNVFKQYTGKKEEPIRPDTVLSARDIQDIYDVMNDLVRQVEIIDYYGPITTTTMEEERESRNMPEVGFELREIEPEPIIPRRSGRLSKEETYPEGFDEKDYINEYLATKEKKNLTNKAYQNLNIRELVGYILNYYSDNAEMMNKVMKDIKTNPKRMVLIARYITDPDDGIISKIEAEQGIERRGRVPITSSTVSPTSLDRKIIEYIQEFYRVKNSKPKTKKVTKSWNRDSIIGFVLEMLKNNPEEKEKVAKRIIERTDLTKEEILNLVLSNEISDIPKELIEKIIPEGKGLKVSKKKTKKGGCNVCPMPIMLVKTKKPTTKGSKKPTTKGSKKNMVRVVLGSGYENIQSLNDKQKKQMLSRFKLLQGQILAGNNNNDIKEEFKNTLNKMYLHDMIEKKDFNFFNKYT